MPIMGFGLLSSKWTVNTHLTTNQLAAFVKILNTAKDRYAYAGNTRFWKTINLNLGLEGSYIATYDIAKSGIPFIQYKTILEALLDEANNILIYNPKLAKKFKNFKYDVVGSWDDGHIIMLSK